MEAVNLFKISELSICHSCINMQKDCSFVHKICSFAKPKKKNKEDIKAHVSTCAEYKVAS